MISDPKAIHHILGSYTWDKSPETIARSFFLNGGFSPHNEQSLLFLANLTIASILKGLALVMCRVRQIPA